MNINKNIIGIILMVFGPFVMAQDSVPDLWKKAVNISKQNEGWIPGLMKTKETIWDINGNEVNKTVLDIEIYKTKENTLDARIIKKEFSKVDMSEEQQNKLFDENDLKSDPAEEPFNPSNQIDIANIKFVALEEFQNIPCIKYSYLQEIDGVLLNGYAWLSKDSGKPLKVAFKINEKITKDEYTVKSIQGTIVYASTVDTAWYPVSIQYRLAIETTVYLFFDFDGDVEASVLLSNYFKK